MATEQAHDEEWGAIPFELVHLFHNRTISARLFRNAEHPPLMISQRMASIVGWTGRMRATAYCEMTMTDFLDAHINHNSEQDGRPVPPFFYPESGLAPDDAQGGSSTSTPTSVSSDIVFPVFVQVKHCPGLDGADVVAARSTLQLPKVKDHGLILKQFCQPHGHYISLIIGGPAEIAILSISRSLVMHHDDVTEIALEIDGKNFDLFSENHMNNAEE
ncbi:hypothetical protein BGZ94_000352 [Podila epigama]|nr:hypothetical protein BGZ94_000352 [Podila epigama]